MRCVFNRSLRRGDVLVRASRFHCDESRVEWRRRFQGIAAPVPAGPTALPDKAHPVKGLVNPAIRRSEEHTSELQSRFDLVCRLLLEKKKYKYIVYIIIHKYNM